MEKTFYLHVPMYNIYVVPVTLLFRTLCGAMGYQQQGCFILEKFDNIRFLGLVHVWWTEI